jgi:hypothetical protein
MAGRGATTWDSGGYAVALPAGVREVALRLPGADGPDERAIATVPGGDANHWLAWSIPPAVLRARVERRLAAVRALHGAPADGAIDALLAVIDDADAGQRAEALGLLERRVARAGEWWTLSTPQLTVRTMIDAPLTAAVVVHQACLRRRLVALLGLPARALADRPTITIADSGETCARLAKGQVAQGFFAFSYSTDGRILDDTVYSWADPGQRTFATFPVGLLAHEETHQVLQGCAGRRRLPAFMDEGIAVVMQGWDLARNVDDQLRSLREGPAYGSEAVARLPGPGTLVAVTEWNQGDPMTVGLRYAAAGSFMRWMMIDPLRRGALMGILTEAFRGGDAARRFRGEEGRAWERGWREWLAERPIDGAGPLVPRPGRAP